MKIEILLARDGGESRGAVLTDGVLTDYRAQRAAAPSRAGGVYRARVKKIVPGLAGAVVEIPDGEAWLDLARTRGAKPREGALVTIQIVQDAQGGKLARAAADPMLAGRFLAFQPFAAKSALSHRIADNDARAARRAAREIRKGGRAHRIAHGARRERCRARRRSPASARGVATCGAGA